MKYFKILILLLFIPLLLFGVDCEYKGYSNFDGIVIRLSTTGDFKLNENEKTDIINSIKSIKYKILPAEIGLLELSTWSNAVEDQIVMGKKWIMYSIDLFFNNSTQFPKSYLGNISLSFVTFNDSRFITYYGSKGNIPEMFFTKAISEGILHSSTDVFENSSLLIEPNRNSLLNTIKEDIRNDAYDKMNALNVLMKECP